MRRRFARYDDIISVRFRMADRLLVRIGRKRSGSVRGASDVWLLFDAYRAKLKKEAMEMADDLNKHAMDIMTAMGELASGAIDRDTAVGIVKAAMAHFDDLAGAIKDELVQKIANFEAAADPNFFLECSGLLGQSAKFTAATLQ